MIVVVGGSGEGGEVGDFLARISGTGPVIPVY